MPVERVRVGSISQCCEMFELDPSTVVGWEQDRDGGLLAVVSTEGHRPSTSWIIAEYQGGRSMSQTIGSLPQLADTTIRRKPKKGKRRCSCRSRSCRRHAQSARPRRHGGMGRVISQHYVVWPSA